MTVRAWGGIEAWPNRPGMIPHNFKVECIVRLPGHGLARARIYPKINAYLFEGSMSPASWGSGRGLGDRLDLFLIRVGMSLNLTHDLKSSGVLPMTT